MGPNWPPPNQPACGFLGNHCSGKENPFSWLCITLLLHHGFSQNYFFSILIILVFHSLKRFLQAAVDRRLGRRLFCAHDSDRTCDCDCRYPVRGSRRELNLYFMNRIAVLSFSFMGRPHPVNANNSLNKFTKPTNRTMVFQNSISSVRKRDQTQLFFSKVQAPLSTGLNCIHRFTV